MEQLLNRVLAKTKDLPHLNVGFFEGATYPHSNGSSAGNPYPDGTPVAAVAAFNEFGTDRIPPRPFMRQTIAKNQAAWGEHDDSIQAPDRHRTLAEFSGLRSHNRGKGLIEAFSPTPLVGLWGPQ